MDRKAGCLHVVSSLLRGATALIAAALLLPATAVAATPPALTVSPAAPRVGQPITLKLRAHAAAMFRPSSDIRTSITTGALVATGLPADPLCTPAGAAEPRAFDVADGAGSSATLRASGHTDMTLVVRADLFAFTGCLPAVLTPTTGAMSLVLSGDVGPGGLNALTLNGSAGPLALAGVGDATVAFHLVTQIDLSGRG